MHVSVLAAPLLHKLCVTATILTSVCAGGLQGCWLPHQRQAVAGPPQPKWLPLQEAAEAAECQKKQLTSKDSLQETLPSPDDCLCRRLPRLLPLTRSS